MCDYLCIIIVEVNEISDVGGFYEVVLIVLLVKVLDVLVGMGKE